MLSLLALTYTAARLGFEAQNAAAFRLLRLAGGISKRAADEVIPGEIIPKAAIVSPIDVAPEPVRVAPKRRHAAKKIHKKSAAVRKRRRRG